MRRDRLVAALTAAADAKLALVVAPAGSGKTTLLSEWRSSPAEPRPFAWLSVDAEDNDPVRLFEGVIGALKTVDPGLGEHALAQLGGPAGLTQVVLPSLLNDLAALPERLVLVLDDLQAIANPDVHAGLAFLLDHQPGNVQVALASRAEPPLPIGRLRVRAEVVEVRSADLRFTRDEADALLEGALGFALDSHDVARLHERTEGWAAGLQLAALSLDGREDVHDFISTFAGDDRPLVDYLGFEVLDGQPADVQDFLLRTAILERLSGPLCDAVTSQDGSALRLDRLERAGLFLMPLDTKRRWYRCHGLFRELLLAELDRTQPAAIPALHRRAAAWHRDQGAVAQAIHHATAAGDLGAAAELISASWYGFLQRGRIETVAGWLAALGDAAASRDAGLCLTKAWIGINTGRLDDVERWTAAAERAGDGAAATQAGIAGVREIHRYMSGDVGRAVEAGRRSVERGDTAWRPVGCPVLGIALFWTGRPEEAANELEDAVGLAKAEGNHLAVIHATAGLAAIAAEAGDDAEASTRADAALALADETGLDGHWATTMARVVQGRALERSGRPLDADAQIGRAAELSRRGVASVEIGYALLAQAEARRFQGDARAASELVGQARGIVDRCPDPGILADMLERTERRLARAPRAQPRADGELSERELAVLRLLGGELSQREIGAALYLSLNTIKTHVRRIYRKLGVEARDEAVARARELELL